MTKSYSLLEQRLQQIVELRLSNLSDEEIAQELSLPRRVVRLYEESAKRAIKESREEKGSLNIKTAASRIRISPVVMDMYVAHFKISTHQRKRYVDSIEDIRQAVADGLRTPKDIGENVGLSPTTVYQYSRAEKIEGVESLKGGGRKRRSLEGKVRKRKPLEERVGEIRQAVAEGFRTVGDISGRIGLNVNTVGLYVRGAGIEGVERRKTREERVGIISTALEEGVDSLEELCKKTELQPNGLYNLCKDRGIVLPDDLKPYRHRPEMDEGIDQGLPLEEIGANAGVTRERARQYINFSGQYEVWKQNKLEKKQKVITERGKRKKLLRHIHGGLKARLSQLASKKGWAYEKAVEYITSRKIGTSYSLERLVPMFEKYEGAQRDGVKLSLEKLGGDSGFSEPTVGKILNNVGLEALCWNPKQFSRSRLREEAIKRSSVLDLSLTNISYFLDVSSTTIIYHLRNEKKKKLRKRFIFSLGRGQILTYKLASQIYEAGDLGFSPDEISELLGPDKRVVNYALSHKKRIAKKLVKSLRIMFGDTNIEKPYLEQRVEEYWEAKKTNN